MDNQAASPDQLEREIAQTRAAIDHKLSLLQQRLSPRRVAGQVANSMGAQGGAFARNLGATLRDNPVPALLLGVGICWLMLAGRDGRGYVEDGRYGEDEDADLYAEDAQDEALAQSAYPESAYPESAYPEAAAPRTAAALAAAEAERAHAAQAYEGRLHGDGTPGVAAGRR
ncbi:MAG TPA: DUF3618 domain-containing protein [Kiloniellaceae bacterium]